VLGIFYGNFCKRLDITQNTGGRVKEFHGDSRTGGLQKDNPLSCQCPPKPLFGADNSFWKELAFLSFGWYQV
jgi:hypothetical protein